MERVRLGLAMCGSFCTFKDVMKMAQGLCEKYDVYPIMSPVAGSADTRFGEAEDFRRKLAEWTGKPIIDTIVAAEPIGPKKLLDVLLIAPCTGNTIAKLANGIADTSVTLAAKAHLRNDRPIVVAVSTNDGLSGNAKNLGALLARRNFYFVPFGQDSPTGKPTSLVAKFALADETIEAALRGEQLQPMLV